MGFKIKINNIGVAKICNWNDIESDFLKDVNRLTIIVDELYKDLNGDIQKLNVIKSLKSLKEIQVISKNPKNIKYSDIVLKNIQIPITAMLLDDFENKGRSDVNLEGLGYNSVYIPPEYSQWGAKPQKYGLPSNYVYFFENDLNGENMAILENEIEKWHRIPELTLVDKVVLVSNYLQSNMQYVQGEVSYAQGKKYIAKGIKESDYGAYNSVYTMLKYHIGNCQAFAKITMIMLNNPKMNVNCRIMVAPAHTYNIIYDGDKSYGLDTTWGVTRNPNKVKRNLRATEFYDGYVLFGQEELEEMNKPEDYHTPKLPLKSSLEPIKFSREELKKSREKLERYGIEFHYPNNIYVQQELDEDQELDEI